MEASKPNPEHSYSLSPEEAAEAVAEQAVMCEILSNHPNLSFGQIPPEIIEQVMVHVMTCQDRIHHIEGLPTDSE